MTATAGCRLPPKVGDRRMHKKKFSAGIHNYCNRRCERCDSTGVCLLHDEIEKADRCHKRRGEDPHDLDVTLEDIRRALERARRLFASPGGPAPSPPPSDPGQRVLAFAKPPT